MRLVDLQHFDNVLTKFINKRTDAQKTDVNLLIPWWYVITN